MENKKNLSLLDKFKGFIFGFVFAVVAFATIVHAANNEIVQKKWKVFWRGADWIAAGEVIKAKELAENLEWLKQQIDNLQDNNTTVSINNEIGLQNFPDVLRCYDYRHDGGWAIYYLLGTWKINGKDIVV